MQYVVRKTKYLCKIVYINIFLINFSVHPSTNESIAVSNVSFYILGLTGYHHEPMKLLQIMWLINGTHQTHRCRKKLVL